MALNIIQGYTPSTTEPIDSRFVAADSASRYSIPSFGAYNGLIVYQEDTKVSWVLTEKTRIDKDEGWTALGASSSTSGSYATTGSNTFIGDQSISGSLTISGSLNVISGSISTSYVYVDTYDSQSYQLIDNPACVYRFSNTTGQNINIYLPNASTCPGRIYYISRPSESGGTINIVATPQQIEARDGTFGDVVSLSSNEKCQWISDGTSWILIMTNGNK